MSASVRLDPESVEAVARRVVELLRGESVAAELIDAAEVARRYGVARSWAYDHAAELGAVRLGESGEGRRPRLRFNAARVAAALAADPSPEPERPKRAEPRRRLTSGHELLPIRRPTR